MTHEHLSLEALDRLKRNADDDDDGRAAHREGGVLDDDAGDDRQDRDDRQIQSAKERDLVDAYRKNKALQPAIDKLLDLKN